MQKKKKKKKKAHTYSLSSMPSCSFTFRHRQEHKRFNILSSCPACCARKWFYILLDFLPEAQMLLSRALLILQAYV